MEIKETAMQAAIREWKGKTEEKEGIRKLANTFTVWKQTIAEEVKNPVELVICTNVFDGFTARLMALCLRISSNKKKSSFYWNFFSTKCILTIIPSHSILYHSPYANVFLRYTYDIEIWMQ